MKIARRHEVGFYPDDASLLVDVTQFIGAALKAGHGAIVLATESHRNSLLRRLETHGVDIAAAIELGKYISVDAVDNSGECGQGQTSGGQSAVSRNIAVGHARPTSRLETREVLLNAGEDFVQWNLAAIVEWSRL